MGLCLLAPAWLAAQEFDDELQLSSDVVYWYRISNAAPGLDGLTMTDVNGSTGSEEYQNMIFMLPTEADDLRSQWKLTAGEEGKVIITNRATGSQIAGTSFWMPVGVTIFAGGIGSLILVVTMLPVVYWKVSTK